MKGAITVGVVIDMSMVSAAVLERTSSPIVFCSFPARAARIIDNLQYVPLNLNLLLTEELLRYPATQRNQRAHDEIMSIVYRCRNSIFLENYEVLFDPFYGIDALKVFEEIARKQKVVVKWCGGLNGDVLEYATPQYPDYHLFRIKDYDITCVK